MGCNAGKEAPAVCDDACEPRIVQDGEDARLQAAFGKGMEAVSFIGVALHLKSVLHRRVAAATLAKDRNSKHAHSDRSRSMRAARKSVAEHGAPAHGSVELLKQRLEFAGLAPEAIDPDGNCQFRALSYQLYGTQEHHAYVRGRCCDEMVRSADSYNIFFEPGTCDFEAFVKRMREGRTWGDELTLRAAADMFSCRIHVITSTPENWHLQYTPEKESVKALFLTYISPVHYNAVCREHGAPTPT